MTHTSKTQFTNGDLIDKLFFPFTYNENVSLDLLLNDFFILKGENDRFLDLNFGSFEIRLGEKELDDEVRFHVRDINNKIVLERVLLFSDLKQS